MKIKKTSLEDYEYDPQDKQGYISMRLETEGKTYVVYVVTGPYNSIEKHFNDKFDVCFYEVSDGKHTQSYIRYNSSVFGQIYNIAKGIGQKMMRNQTPNVLIN